MHSEPVCRIAQSGLNGDGNGSTEQLTLKKCCGCGIEKPLSEFNRKRGTKDGRRSRCRICQGIEGKQYQQTHVEELKAYRRGTRAAAAQRHKKYRAKHPDKVKARADKWRKAHPREKYAVWRRWDKKQKDILTIGFSEKHPCSKCGALPAEGHHPDYNKPLEVVWLCKIHHKEWHRYHVPVFPKDY